jgi:hypothetical protein
MENTVVKPPKNKPSPTTYQKTGGENIFPSEIDYWV